jgi:predicted metal-dependent peptidase
VLGDIVLVDDTSGSVWEVQDVFASEMQGILEAYNCSVTIVYCDAAVQRVQEWSSGDGDLKLYPVGGGGTSHVPVWEWLKTFDKEPACVVCLTDCLTAYGSDPGVPVLWCCYDNKHAAPPFGRLVHIEKENR